MNPDGADDRSAVAPPSAARTVGPLAWIAGTIGAVIGVAFVAFVVVGICVGAAIQSPDDLCLVYPEEPAVLAPGPGATLIATEGCLLVTPQSDVWFYYATAATEREITDFYIGAISDYVADHAGSEPDGLKLTSTEEECVITVTVATLGVNHPDESDDHWQDRGNPPAGTRSYYAINESRTCPALTSPVSRRPQAA